MDRLLNLRLPDVVPHAIQRLHDRLRASELGRRLARGIVWSTIGAVASRGLALLASVITARIVGKQVFGELGILQSTIFMFTTFATFGMGLTATKHVAQYKTIDPARAGRIIGMSNLISWLTGSSAAFLLLSLAPWLAKHSLGAPQLGGVLRLSALCLFLTVVSEAQLGALSGLEAFKRRSVVQFFASLVALPVTVVGVYWWRLYGAVSGLIVSQAVLVFLNSRALYQETRASGITMTLRLSKQELNLLWGFSIPTLVGAAIYVPVMWLANAIIVNSPHGFAEMGLFSAADRWRTAIMFLPSLLGGVALPMLSSLGRDLTKYYFVLWTNVKLSFFVSCCAAVPIAVLAHWIMASYGPEFSEGRQVLVILCAVSIITATFWIMGQSLMSQGLMWTVAALNFCWATVLLVCCWFLRSRGATGLAMAYLAAETIRLAIAAALMRSRAAKPQSPLAACNRHLEPGTQRL